LLARGTPIVAFEIVEASASDLRDGLAARGRPAEIVVGDGLAGVCGRAQEGDLVLLDPFDVHARDGSLTAAEAFASLAARGVRALLWYAIYDADDTGEWIGATVSDLDVWSTRVVSDTSLGGLAGCGFLGANLSAPTVSAAAAIVDDLALALAPVRPGLGVR
jgi:hypothetical protein